MPSESGEIWWATGTGAAWGAWWRAAAGSLLWGPGGGAFQASAGASVSGAQSSSQGASSGCRPGRNGPSSCGRGGEVGAEDFAGAPVLDGDTAAAGLPEGATEGLTLALGDGDGVVRRPGRWRPSPACRPASDVETEGSADVSRTGFCSPAWATGVVSRRSEATVIAHRVRSAGVTG
jgi:hypothetical protein